MYYAQITSTEESIWGVKMISPYEVDLTTNTQLVRPGYLDSTFTGSSSLLAWERYRNEEIGYASIVEGPFMIKHDGKYYLT